MPARDGDYVDQLGTVLRRRDVSALRAFLIEQAGRFGDERQVAAIQSQGDEELTALLHRMILARGDLADLHADSARELGGAADVSPAPASDRAPSTARPKRRRRRRPS